MTECEAHLLVGCATCAGTDDLRDPGVVQPTLNQRSRRPWTAADNRVARDITLTSHEAAIVLNRTVGQVSAHRINRLGMRDYAGYRPHPRG